MYLARKNLKNFHTISLHKYGDMYTVEGKQVYVEKLYLHKLYSIYVLHIFNKFHIFIYANIHVGIYIYIYCVNIGSTKE